MKPFYEREDCITLSKSIDPYGQETGIFVFKNFFPEDMTKKIEDQLESFRKKEIVTPKDIYDKSLISWYDGKIAPVPDNMFEAWELISELLYPTWVIHPQFTILTVKPGDGGMFIHSDSPGRQCDHMLSQNDVWSTCCELDFGVVGYMGNFTGGAIFYPQINPDGTVKGLNPSNDCLEYTPERRDLIIHSAVEPYSHGVREVESGIRYAYSNFSLKAANNPGTFYNYKTPEYIEQVGDKSPEKIRVWGRPLKTNPRFTDEKLAEMKASGLEGPDLPMTFFKDEYL